MPGPDDVFLLTRILHPGDQASPQALPAVEVDVREWLKLAK